MDTLHPQHYVSQIVQNDPDVADQLFNLLVLTDASTPTGAAAHQEVLNGLCALTSEFRQWCRDKQERVRATSFRSTSP